MVNWSFPIYKDEQVARLIMSGSVSPSSPILTPSEGSPSSKTSVVPWSPSSGSLPLKEKGVGGGANTTRVSLGWLVLRVPISLDVNTQTLSA